MGIEAEEDNNAIPATEEPVAEASAAPVPEISAGVMLKSMREKAGIEVEELATILKVAPQKLQALEADDYSALPALFFARGLAANICRHFGQDAHPVLAKMPGGASEKIPHPQGDNNNSQPIIQTPIDITHRSNKVMQRVVLFLIAIAVLAAGVFAAFRFITNRQAAADNPQAATLPASAAIAPAADASATAPASAASPALPLTLQPAASAALPASGSTNSGPNILQIAATHGDTWVQVSTKNGRVLFKGTLQTGQQRQLTIAAYPIRLNISKAENTQVIDRGQLFDLASIAAQGRARFDIQP